MRRNLIALAFGAFALVSPATAQEDYSKKPHEQVQKYLNRKGIGREEFKVKHFFFVDKDGTMYFNKAYDFDGKPFGEQYSMTDVIIKNEEGISNIISYFPVYYFFEGTWFLDPRKDGFNGNETIVRIKKVEEPKKTAKCNPGRDAFCT